MKMGEERSSLSGNFFLHLNILVFGTIYLLLDTAYANGFNPLIQLPTNSFFRNISSFSKPTLLNINDFGAKGDGFTDDTEILQDIWKIACSLSWPSKILLPNGSIYLIGPIDFPGPCQSKVTLRISGSIWAPIDPETWNGSNVHKWLYFHGVKNLVVEGGGSIYGNGEKWWARSCKRNDSNPCTHAPTALTFHRCTHLKVRNVNLVYAQQMHMAFTNCMHVAASNVTVVAPADSPNTDGIHISASVNVELNNIIVYTGDDCISIVSNSSKIRMNQIICGQGHGISIGSLGKYNSYVGVEDVTLKGAFIADTENGLRIKTWQGGSGFARRIMFENVLMQNVSNPIIIDQYYCDSPVPCLNQSSAVNIENISYRDIKGTSASENAITFNCSDTYPCKRIHLEKIYLTASSGITKSFCWEAYGRSVDMVSPPSCISSGDIIIHHNVKSNSTYWQSKHYY